MDEDRRVPKRVPLRDRTCRVQSRKSPLRIELVNISPGGACLSVDRPGSGAVDDLLAAWLNDEPMRVYLDQDVSAVALPVWARGPRPNEQRVLFGLRFVQPIADFGTMIREMLRD